MGHLRLRPHAHINTSGYFVDYIYLSVLKLETPYIILAPRVEADQVNSTTDFHSSVSPKKRRYKTLTNPVIMVLNSELFVFHLCIVKAKGLDPITKD